MADSQTESMRLNSQSAMLIVSTMARAILVVAKVTISIILATVWRYEAAVTEVVLAKTMVSVTVVVVAVIAVTLIAVVHIGAMARVGTIARCISVVISVMMLRTMRLVTVVALCAG
jgi:hypothetical protein